MKGENDGADIWFSGDERESYPERGQMTDTVRVGDLMVLRAMPDRATRPAVLCIHGYFADATMFSDWLPLLAAHGAPAYALHLRGRAGSHPAVDLGRVSMDDFVDDAARIARELETPSVIGHSMGGLIAQRVAEQGLVRSALLLAPAPPRGISILSPRLIAKQLKYLPAIVASRAVEPKPDDLRELVLNRLPPDEQGAWIERLHPDSGRAGRDMSITGVPVDASKVRCPVMVLSGRDDHFIPPAIAERVARRYHAPYRSLANHGHMLPVEPGWREVFGIANEWLAGAGRGS